MSLGDNIPPIPIYKERLARIGDIFNISLKTSPMEPYDYSPTFKLGFINNGSHYTDRMFTIEERRGMLFFTRNVPFDDEYRRSVYSIPKSKILYVHYTSGVIFGDFFDYAHIEQQEVSEHVTFFYEDKFYNNIREISTLNPTEYKTKTRIMIKLNQTEMQNDIHVYATFFGKTCQLKVGYFVSDENIQFYHVNIFMGKQFGLVPSPTQFFQMVDSDPNSMYSLTNYVFADPRVYGAPKLTKNGKVKELPSKNPYIGVSLLNKLEESKNQQERRFIIGWFLCEILYPYIFADAL